MPLPAIRLCNASCRIINGSTIWRRSISQTRDITHIRQTACGREKGLHARSERRAARSKRR
jgi:hypothetical protein